MITLKHVEIYKKNGGDGDRFVRNATTSEETIMSYENWSLIESLIQDISLIETGLVSESYKKDINKRLEENCENEIVINELRKMQ